MTRLNRLPTKTESFFGAVVALLLSSGLGFVLVYVFRAAYERPEILTPFVISVLAVLSAIFAWSSALFLRILFGSPELPGFKGQVMIGWFMVVLGIVLCGGSVLIASSRPVLHLSQGVAAISLGLLWIYQARKGARPQA